MTWVDLVMLLFIALAGWKGWRDGLVKQVVTVVGVVLAYVVSRMCYMAVTPWVSRFLKLPTIDPHNPLRSFLHGQLQVVVAFVLLFLVTFFGVKLLGMLLGYLARLPGLAVVNRFGGLLLGGVVAILVVALVANLLHLWPNKGVQHVLQGSSIAQFLIWKFGTVVPKI